MAKEEGFVPLFWPEDPGAAWSARQGTSPLFLSCERPELKVKVKEKMQKGTTCSEKGESERGNISAAPRGQAFQLSFFSFSLFDPL